MSKDLEKLYDIKSTYGDLFYSISECVNELSQYDIKRFNSGECFYKNNLSTLKNLMDKIEVTEQEIKDRKFLSKLFKRDNLLENLVKELDKYDQTIDQLIRCSKCKCFKCVKDCSFNPCVECKIGSCIMYCDKENYNIRIFDEYIIPLVNNDTGKESRYRTLCVIEIGHDDKFIFLENLFDKDDKLILEYIPTIRGIEYGEITDVELFDKLVSIYKRHS